MPTAAYCCSRGADTVGGCVSHELLCYAVFQRMITNNHQSSRGAKEINGLFERQLEIL